MKPEVATKILELLEVHQIGSRTGWVTSCCPLAPVRHEGGTDSNPSFGIKVAPGEESFYTCFSCRSSGTVSGLLLELIHYAKHKPGVWPIKGIAAALELARSEGVFIPEYTPEHFQKQAEVLPWPDTYLNAFASWSASADGYQYVTEARQVPVATADELSLRYDFKMDTVCFPIRDFEGRLCGFRGRKLYHDDKTDRFMDYRWNGKTSTGLVWLGEHHLSTSKPLIIVEGLFDYARVFAYYKNVACMLSAGCSKAKLRRLAGFWKIVLLLDNDAAGRLAAKAVRKELGHESLIIEAEYPEGASDPGSMAGTELESMLSQYVKVNPSSGV